VIEFSRPVPLADVDRRPVQRQIEAEPAERALLAKRLGLAALQSLTADFTAVKRRGTIIVTGRFDAAVEQVCIVTLEPFAAQVSGEIDEVYSESEDGGDNGEVDIDPDTPEPLMGDSLDIGEVVAQCLALEIDPHPRAPGADLADLEAPAEPEHDPAHPFAALRKLHGNS